MTKTTTKINCVKCGVYMTPLATVIKKRGSVNVKEVLYWCKKCKRRVGIHEKDTKVSKNLKVTVRFTVEWPNFLDCDTDCAWWD